MQKEVSVADGWSRKYPEQVVLAVTRSQEGRINLMAVGWMAIVSDEPPMFMLGIDDHAYTLELIRENREFVVAYPSVSMAQATLYAGTVHGHKEDKGLRSGLTFIPAAKIGVPLVADAVANFECRLVDILRPGNCPLVIGEIVATHVNSDPAVKRLYTLDSNYRLGGV